ncbi:hypothetical protein BC834DRAFT_819418, partial [Gloeopeniophorella convolvens]
NAYKVRSFQRAIAAVYQHGKPITSGQEAAKLCGIGPGIANRIEWFLQGPEYQLQMKAEARLAAVQTFRKIHGVGEQTATNLANAGALTLADLHLPKYSAFLTAAQKIGFLYSKHLERPVPREEAEEIATFIRDHISSNFEVHLTGAYRRGSAELSSVSVLIHHPQYVHIPQPPPPTARTFVGIKGKLPVPFYQADPLAAQLKSSPLLQDVVRPLENTSLLAAAVAAGPNKWRGVALVPLRVKGPDSSWQEVGDRMRDIRAMRGTYVRLELNLAPPKCHGAAQLALTGDEEFVRTARLAAIRRSMHLNEWGLWQWHSQEEAAMESSAEGTSYNSTSGYWELIESESEDRILEELELGPIEPQRRNFRFLTPKNRTSARAGMLDLSPAALVGDVVTHPRKRGRKPKHRARETEPSETL